jgi:hypothetical protein
MAVNHYGRTLFMKEFLQQLNNGSESSPIGARVISVLAPGTEGPIIEDDLELKKNYSITMASRVLTAYQTLTAEYLARKYPAIGWVHAYPSLVMTGSMRGLPWYGRMFTPLVAPFAVPKRDSAEGFLWLSTREEGKTGLHVVDWKGKSVDTRHGGTRIWGVAGVKGWWKEGQAEKVWKHTEDTFKRVLG